MKRAGQFPIRPSLSFVNKRQTDHSGCAFIVASRHESNNDSDQRSSAKTYCNAFDEALYC